MLQFSLGALSRRKRRRISHPRNGLSDEFLDGRNALGFGRSDDSDGGPASARTARAADAMHVIFRMVRNVEIEHVAYRGDIKPACRNIGSDQKGDLVVAKLVERGGAGGLIDVAMERNGGKAMADQGPMQRRHLALAVAEDDGIRQPLGRADEGPQDIGFAGGSWRVRTRTCVVVKEWSRGA